MLRSYQTKKQFKINKTTTIGIVGFSGLLVFLQGLFVLPLLSASEPTHAATPVEPTISITPASGITMDMTPAGGTAGSFGTATASVTVNSTNVSGYTLTMNTETTDPDLKNSKIDYTDPTKADLKITNLTASTTESNFSPNKWGYNVSKSGTYLKGASGTYVPVPNSGSSTADKQIDATTTAGNGTYTFTYGVKANNNLPAGAYKNILVFSATANEIPLISMQEATYANCGENMYDNRGTDAYKDIEYTTAEINNLCWMTRNLDLPGGTKLSHADTNVPEGYSTTTAGFTNGDTLPASSTSGFSSDATAYVYNSNSTTCGSNSPCYSYYSWLAATAGYTSSSTPVNYDICPSGWRLPTQAEFNTLKSSYSTGAELVAAPFLGVYAGSYYRSYFSGGGSNSGYWSSTADGSSNAYRLNFSSSNASVLTTYRSNGYSVRCVKENPALLYNKVAKMSKGTQTVAQLRTAIDASNSGVYEYNSSVFGADSDATKADGTKATIYYYRGILDNTVGTYGSDGDNAAWPNTVVLSTATSKSGLTTSNTCWRIVRTTGSGGVKMIYQGKWTANGTNGSCKNSSTSANAVSSVYFNRRSSSSTNNYDTKGRIIYVGYNYSSTASHQTGTSSVANSTLFVNGTKSNLRTQLESWYNSNMTSYTSKLETSAGWCNDRTTYSGTTISTKTTSNRPYRTSSATVNFGAYLRNATSNSQPTLGCPNDTGYDLLTTANGYTSVPSAPLTADEAALAGSGNGSSVTPYHDNSYLRSGDNFWLLSPSYRSSSGVVYEFNLISIGRLSYDYVSNSAGVRPSISLTSGTVATSGTGTATDPWIVNP